MPLNSTKKFPPSDAEAEPLQPSEQPIIICANEGCLMAHWRGVAVAVWSKRPDFDAVTEMEKLLAAANKDGTKISFAALITGRIDLPPAAERARYTELTRSYDDKLVCSAVMFAGTGFWVSALRGVVTSILVVGRHRRRVFANIEELANWLAPTHSAATGRTMEAEELRQALNWMVAQPTVQTEHAAT